ncbi:DNA polymerase III subunit beta [Candidatus Mycalebacterium sp.]
MKIKFKRQPLLNKLQLVAGLTESESPNEILQNILLRSFGKKKECFVAATDIESTIVSYFSPEDTPEADFDILVPARKFLEIIRSMEDDEVVVSVHKNNWMEITTSSGVFKFPFLPGKNFPKIPIASTQAVFSISSQTVSTILPSVLSFAADDSLRRNLNGVFFEKINGKIRLVATDSHRLAYFQKEIVGAGDFEKFILSKKALGEVVKTIKDSESDSETSFFFENKMVFCTTGETTVISNPIDSPFPEYERVVPDFSALEPAVVDKNTMLSAVKRVSIFSEKSGRVDINLAPSTLSVSSGDTDEGEAVDRVSVKFGGDEIKASFNPQFLIDSLNFLDGEEVDFRSGDGTTPGVLTLNGSADFVCILMPVVS